jgi:hypothetical protein
MASPKQPQQDRIPDMKIEKDAALSRFCKQIKAAREDKNEAIQREQEQVAGALDRMKRIETESYTDHGVELVHTQLDKLRVRLVDDDSAGDVE